MDQQAGKIAVEGASIILTPELFELKAAGAAAKGLPPLRQAYVDKIPPLADTKVANSGGESASPPPPDDEDDAKQQTRGEKGQSFRGGKKADRDKWYGQDDKEFQRWWHREGKEEFNFGRDIEDAQNARAAREYWESLGRPRVK